MKNYIVNVTVKYHDGRKVKLAIGPISATSKNMACIEATRVVANDSTVGPFGEIICKPANVRTTTLPVS